MKSKQVESNKKQSKTGTRARGLSDIDWLKQAVDENPIASRAFGERNVILAAAKLLRDMRNHANLTQEQLGQRIGMQQANIARAERGEGRRGLTMETLSRVAKACGQQLILGFAEQGAAEATVKKAATLKAHLVAM